MLDAELPITSTVGSRNHSLDQEPRALRHLPHRWGEFPSVLSYCVGNEQPTFCKYSS